VRKSLLALSIAVVFVAVVPDPAQAGHKFRLSVRRTTSAIAAQLERADLDGRTASGSFGSGGDKQGPLLAKRCRPGTTLRLLFMRGSRLISRSTSVVVKKSSHGPSFSALVFLPRTGSTVTYNVRVECRQELVKAGTARDPYTAFTVDVTTTLPDTGFSSLLYLNVGIALVVGGLLLLRLERRLSRS
jgi:hypothetical protein